MIRSSFYGIANITKIIDTEKNFSLANNISH